MARLLPIFLAVLVLIGTVVFFARQCEGDECAPSENDQSIFQSEENAEKTDESESGVPVSGSPPSAASLPKLREPTQNERVVKLYFYNEAKDKDENGTVLCSKQGVQAVERIIPLSESPIQDTLKLLFQGKLTAEERGEGITTEFPLPGVMFKAFVLHEGQAIVAVTDDEHRTSGGACRVSILRAQIEETVRQFIEVSEVNYRPLDAFQP